MLWYPQISNSVFQFREANPNVESTLCEVIEFSSNMTLIESQNVRNVPEKYYFQSTGMKHEIKRITDEINTT